MSSKSRMSIKKSERSSSSRKSANDRMSANDQMSVTANTSVSKKSRMSVARSKKSSRRAVSRKSRISSAGSSSSKGNNTTMATFLFGLIIQGLVLYYLYNLEDADCNCIRDWRHNFCKLFAILVILVNLVAIFSNIHNNKTFAVVWSSVSVINAYAFFTYIGDLNATKCSCAVTKQPNLNSIMIILRWTELIVAIFVLLGVLSILYTGITS